MNMKERDLVIRTNQMITEISRYFLSTTNVSKECFEHIAHLTLTLNQIVDCEYTFQTNKKES